MQPYTPETEKAMRSFYNSLNEKDARRYAGVEALKLGRGGRNYVAMILGCRRRTVSKGAKEVSSMSNKEIHEQIGEPKRIRQGGGGRKSSQKTYPDIDEKFQQVLRDHTAGEPMNENIVWTDLTSKDIAKRLYEDHNIKDRDGTVRK